MSVYGITVVRDEADIVETSLRHMAREVDHLIVGDHRSTDGTTDILAALADELPLTVVTETHPGHHQDERMTRYAAMAHEQGAEWVVPFDADEIWYSDGGTLREALAACPEQIGVLACRGWDHMVRDDEGPFSPWRQPTQQPLPKVVFRAHPQVQVAMGNHSVAHPLPSGEGPINYRHFQYRDFEQLVRKVREGTKATDAAGHDTDTDFHWRELAAMSDDELRLRWAVTCSQDFVYDPPPIRRDVSVSVVVPTLDRADLLARCVAAVAETTDAELVIERDEHRDGFAAVCNRAAKSASGDVLVFLNDDTIPQSGWVDALTRRSAWGVVGGLLVYPDGRPQHSGVFLRRDGQGRVEAFNRQSVAESGEVPAVTGACLAIGRDLWDSLGGFDEGFRNGYEDVDLCLRAREAGGRVFLAADCQVVHLESQSDHTERFGSVESNVALLQERWGDLEV